MKIKNELLNKLIPIAEELQQLEVDLYASPVKEDSLVKRTIM